MTKRISLILVLALVLTLCTACAAAPTEITETLTYDDGSYMIITLKEEGNTYTTRKETPEELMQTGSVQNGTHSPQITPMRTSNNTYEIMPLGSSNSTNANSTAESYGLNAKSQEKYFWIDTAIIRTFKPQKYITWVEVEEGAKVPVWHDIHGNILYRTKFATKYCSYYSADGQLLWTMSVTGMFKENALDRYCVLVSNSINVYETDSWYVIAETTDTQDDAVGYTVQFGRTNLGVTIAEPSYTMTLSKDPFGNFL